MEFEEIIITVKSFIIVRCNARKIYQLTHANHRRYIDHFDHITGISPQRYLQYSCYQNIMMSYLLYLLLYSYS